MSFDVLSEELPNPTSKRRDIVGNFRNVSLSEEHKQAFKASDEEIMMQDQTSVKLKSNNFPIIWIGFKKMLAIFAGTLIEFHKADVPDIHNALIDFANYIRLPMEVTQPENESGLPYCQFTCQQLENLFHPAKFGRRLPYFSGGDHLDDFDLDGFCDSLLHKVMSYDAQDGIAIAEDRQIPTPPPPPSPDAASGIPSPVDRSKELNELGVVDG